MPEKPPHPPAAPSGASDVPPLDPAREHALLCAATVLAGARMSGSYQQSTAEVAHVVCGLADLFVDYLRRPA